MKVATFLFFAVAGSAYPDTGSSGMAPDVLQQVQNKRIRGVVTDRLGDPVIGANVLQKGTTNGIITDIDGAFEITVPVGSRLAISYIGYIAQEIPITEGTPLSLTVRLAEDMQSLDEVVVIGYGTMKKSDLTGSVSSFKKEALNKGVNTSLSGLLEGKAAGVQITTASGEPGGGINVMVRGAGSVNAGSGPLYVIDGLPIETGNVVDGSGANMPGHRVARSPISNINPGDIESIEILKDASATAIYGARGANGVILVTTKKGSTGKVRINYSGYAGFQSPKDMIAVLNADQYKSILNEIQANPKSNVNASEIVGDIQDGGTDWQDLLIRTAVVHSHSLSFTGGSESLKYFTSINYFDQEGVLKNSAYQRYDGRINLEYRDNRITFGANINASYTHDDAVPIGYTTNEEGGVLYAARGFDPTLRVFNADGTYQTSSLINLDNPLALLNGKTNWTDNYRTMGTLFTEYTILKGWTAKVNFGFDYRNSRRDSYVSSITKSGLARSGIAGIMTGTRTNYLGEFTSNYTLDLPNSSSLNAMAGVTYQKFAYVSFNGSGSGFPVDETLTNNMGMADASYYSMGSSKNNNKLLSYIGRVNYNLWDKFLFTATLRIDGSSRFGENNKYGYFPSGAIAWKAHQYDFIRDLDLFSNLKVRASFGRTGNQDIGNFLSLTTFGLSDSQIILDEKKYVILEPQRLANPDLKWETTEQINIGIDMGFLDNRISVSADYFQKKTYDMLFNKPIPASTGFSSVMQNIGNIKNSGFELAIDSRNLTGRFSWNTSLNLSTLRNRVTDLGGIPEIIHTSAGQTTSEIAIIREGAPVNSFYGYATDGIWQTQQEIDASGIKYAANVKPGDIKFVDQNDDGYVNASDRVIIGKSIPSFTFGMTNEFSFMNFTLNFFIDGATGFKIMNNSMVESFYPVSHRRNRIAEPYLNRWTETNPSNKYPSFVNQSQQGAKPVNDLTVENGSYLRLQTVQLSYDIPLKSRNVIQRLGISLTGQNLATITSYSGQDPAFNSNGNSTLKIDFNSYPSYRTFTFGVEIGF